MACLVLTGVAAFLFRRALFGDTVFFSRDIEPFFYPMKAFLVRSVRAGRVPLWNPWTVNGEPFFAALQPAVLYPGSLLLYLLPMPFAFNLLLAAHYPLAGLGLYLLLRRWSLGHGPALVGALAFMLGGYFVSIGNFPNNVQTVAWLPWIWWAWDRHLANGGARDLLWFTLLCGVAFLGGEPEMLAVGVALAFLHGLLRIEAHTRPAGRQLAALVGGAVVAAALVAVQLVPFVELVGHSIRTTSLDLGFASFRAMEPTGLLELLVPPALRVGRFGFSTHLFPSARIPWLLSVYPGVVVLALAAGTGSAPADRRRLAFWIPAGALGLVLALGVSTPVFPVLFRWLPPLRMVRYPEKFIYVTAVGAAVLGASGARGLFSGDRSASRRIIASSAVLAVVLGTVGMVLRARPSALTWACGTFLHGALLCERPEAAAALYGATALRSAALLLVLLGLCAALRGDRISSPVALAAIAALVALDLVVAHDHVNPTADASVVRTAPWAARTLARLDPAIQEYRYRGSTTAASMGSAVMVKGAWEMSNMYLDYETMGPNIGMLWRHLTQDGLQGLEMASVSSGIAYMLNNPPVVRLRLMQLSNVRYYGDATATADSFPGLSLVARAPDLPVRIYRVEGALPRAYLVTRDTVVPDPVRATATALDSGFDRRGSVVVNRSPSPPPSAAARGAVTGASYGDDRVRLTVRSSGPALLVLTDRWYPGWRVTVDGRRAALLRANGLFRAVAVPEGHSVVEFRFRPLSVRVGAWVSGVAWLLLLAFLAGRIRRRRRGGAT